MVKKKTQKSWSGLLEMQGMLTQECFVLIGAGTQLGRASLGEGGDI